MSTTRTETFRVFWVDPLLNGDANGVVDYVDITDVSAVACASVDYDDMDNYRNVIDANFLGRPVSTAQVMTGTRPASSTHYADEFDDTQNATAPKNNTKKRMQWTLTRVKSADSSALISFKCWADEIKGGPVPISNTVTN